MNSINMDHIKPKTLWHVGSDYAKNMEA